MTTHAAISDRLALVGDVGGTHARFALADVSRKTPRISDIQVLDSHGYARAGDAVKAYLAKASGKPSLAVIATAGPVRAGAVRFTNLNWSLSESQLRALGFAQARLVNDFTALALAIPLLKARDISKIGPAIDGERGKPIAAIGPGTGFGAAILLPAEKGLPIAVATEGGHASLAPGDDVEIEILKVLRAEFGHVSMERVLSGPGLVNLHRALATVEGRAAEDADAPEITAGALAGREPHLRTVMRFAAMLGAAAGNFALLYGAQGGVYVAGGIAPAILPLLERSEFRARFEDKGRFRDYLRAIPTAVVLHTDMALLGAAALARSLVATGRRR
ncbi:MAG: glucokinase [Alphaproteobacteria bacterium]|nr:glucokinase [Alphaproteobacteria bacterium]MBV9693477.1 glucokinase [Alphaproteobacteria bacterium]